MDCGAIVYVWGIKSNFLTYGSVPERIIVVCVDSHRLSVHIIRKLVLKFYNARRVTLWDALSVLGISKVIASNDDNLVTPLTLNLTRMVTSWWQKMVVSILLETTCLLVKPLTCMECIDLN